MACAISSLCYSPLLLYLHFFSSWGLGEGNQETYSGPKFGDVETSVSITAGETARLPCSVHFLSDRSVTWLRRRDLHILTVGHHTYSADERFKVVHQEGSDEWTLVIRYAQPRDAGIYDCQINTDPKISHPVTLKILDTSKEVGQTKTKVFVANNTASTSDGDLRVEIQGPRELYIEEGSSLSLTCLVTSLSGPSTLVYWYHNTNLIDYNSPRGGVNLKIDRGRGQTTTHLLVSAVGPGDSGMYSCVPTGSHPATVRVHVNQGENEAAIQQGGLDETSSTSSLTPLPFLTCLLLLLLFVNYQDIRFKFNATYFKPPTLVQASRFILVHLHQHLLSFFVRDKFLSFCSFLLLVLSLTTRGSSTESKSLSRYPSKCKKIGRPLRHSRSSSSWTLWTLLSSHLILSRDAQQKDLFKPEALLLSKDPPDINGR